MNNNYKRFTFIFIITISILLIPLIAMQFTNEVSWKPFDFIIAGILLFTAGFTIDIVLRKISNKKQKSIAIACLIILFFLIWAELAVGFFETFFAKN